MVCLFTKEKSMNKMVFWESHNDPEKVYEALCNGQVVIGDSDTVLGLYAPLSQQGFAALNDLKGRSQKPYLVLVADAYKAQSFIDKPLSASLVKIMNACWPGPVTLICEARKDLPAYVKGNEGTIGLRVPNHKGLQSILSRCEGLFSTSANKTGVPVPESIYQVDKTILEQISLGIFNKESFDKEKVTKENSNNVIKENATKNSRENSSQSTSGALNMSSAPSTSNAIASTILDCTEDQIKLIRAGAYPVALIEHQAGVKIKG